MKKAGESRFFSVRRYPLCGAGIAEPVPVCLLQACWPF